MNTYYLKKFRKRFAIYPTGSGRFTLMDLLNNKFYPSRPQHNICVVEGLSKIIGYMAMSRRLKVYNQRIARKQVKLAKSV